MTVDPTTQTFLTAAAQEHDFQDLLGAVAQRQSATAGIAELGRWFASQGTFLQAGLAAANPPGGCIAPVPPIDLTQQDTLNQLDFNNPSAGDAFDFGYLSDDIPDQVGAQSAAATYAASGTSAPLAALANQAAPIFQDHDYELQIRDSVFQSGAAPTVSLVQTFTAAPPLAATTVLNAQDQVLRHRL